MGVETCWELSATWYAGRLEADWRAPSAARYQQLLADHGLVGPFWSLTG